MLKTKTRQKIKREEKAGVQKAQEWRKHELRTAVTGNHSEKLRKGN